MKCRKAGHACTFRAVPVQRAITIPFLLATFRWDWIRSTTLLFSYYQCSLRITELDMVLYGLRKTFVAPLDGRTDDRRGDRQAEKQTGDEKHVTTLSSCFWFPFLLVRSIRLCERRTDRGRTGRGGRNRHDWVPKCTDWMTQWFARTQAESRLSVCVCGYSSTSTLPVSALPSFPLLSLCILSRVRSSLGWTDGEGSWVVERTKKHYIGYSCDSRFLRPWGIGTQLNIARFLFNRTRAGPIRPD